MDKVMQVLNGYSFSPEMDVWSILLSLLLSFVLGQVLAWVYYFTHSSLSYSRSFVQSLIIITIVISLVMTTISGSFVIAVGLMGALSLIRFRNIIKDTRDITFLFCAVAIGMASGSGRYAIAIIGTFALSAVYLYLHWSNFGMYHAHNAFLRFTFQGSLEPGHPLLQTLGQFCRTFTMVSSNTSAMEDNNIDYAYQLSLRTMAKNELLLSEIRKLDGINNVSMTTQEQLLEI
jgi:uncharacterized membrane protein YhiD involved in acid resistance